MLRVYVRGGRPQDAITFYDHTQVGPDGIMAMTIASFGGTWLHSKAQTLTRQMASGRSFSGAIPPE
jgi:hypothetical protein